MLLVGDEADGLLAAMAAISPDAGPHWDLEAVIPHTIRTKYYSAEVQIEAARLHQGTGPDDLTHVEALVLILGSGIAWERAQSFWQRAQPSGVSIRLAVLWSGGAEQQNQPPGWQQAAEEWCGRESIEWVHGTAGDELRSRDVGLAERLAEPQGLARLVEALEAHVWPRALLAPRAGEGAAAPVALPPGRVQDLSDEAFEAAESDQGSAAGIPWGKANGADDELDQLFAEIAACKQRLQGLGDGERREAAATLAFKMLAALEGDTASSGTSSAATGSESPCAQLGVLAIED